MEAVVIKTIAKREIRNVRMDQERISGLAGIEDAEKRVMSMLVPDGVFLGNSATSIDNRQAYTNLP